MGLLPKLSMNEGDYRFSDDLPNPVEWATAVDLYIRLRLACSYPLEAGWEEERLQKMEALGERLSKAMSMWGSRDFLLQICRNYDAITAQLPSAIQQREQEVAKTNLAVTVNGAPSWLEPFGEPALVSPDADDLLEQGIKFGVWDYVFVPTEAKWEAAQGGLLSYRYIHLKGRVDLIVRIGAEKGRRLCLKKFDAFLNCKGLFSAEEDWGTSDFGGIAEIEKKFDDAVSAETEKQYEEATSAKEKERLEEAMSAARLSLEQPWWRMLVRRAGRVESLHPVNPGFLSAWDGLTAPTNFKRAAISYSEPSGEEAKDSFTGIDQRRWDLLHGRWLVELSSCQQEIAERMLAEAAGASSKAHASPPMQRLFS